MATRYRCAACGNLTRFDVTLTRRTRAFHHYSIGGELTVEDDGVGIPAEDLPRIFDRYVRIAHPETKAASGLGLGLHVVRSLAEAQGGTVEVESLPGKGSRFRLLLPAAEVEI